MRIITSLPANKEFFNKYAPLISRLFIIGIICQIISGLTENGIFYTASETRLSFFFPQWFAVFVSVIIAIIGTLFLELGLRLFLPYSCRLPLAFWTLPPGERVIAGIIHTVTLLLIIASGVLSFVGSIDVVENIAPEAVVISSDSIEQKAAMETARIQAMYKRDSLAVTNESKLQLQAIQSRYDGLIAIEQDKIKNLKSKQRIEKKSYQSAIAKNESRIKELEAERNDKIAAINLNLAATLTDLRETRQNKAHSEAIALKTAIDAIEKKNHSEAANIDGKTTKYGFGLAWLTVLCLLVLIVSVKLDELHKKHSGISQTIIPNQFDFEQGLLTQFQNIVSEKIKVRFYNYLRRIESNTPTLLQPNPPPALFNYSYLENKIYNIIQDESGQMYLKIKNPDLLPGATANAVNPDFVKMENEIQQYLRLANELRATQPDKAKEYDLKADDVIKAYLGSEANPESVLKLRTEIIGYLNGNNPNPFFKYHNRRMIGFSGHSNDPVITTPLYDTKTGEAMTCENCGKTCDRKTWNQRFCGTDCRLNFHAEQHDGKRFSPHMYKNRKL